MLDDLFILIGRFHPLIVHLPIGFVVLGILIELNKKKFGWSNIKFFQQVLGTFGLCFGIIPGV